MNINLPTEMQTFLQQLVESGKYSSEQEAVVAALHLLESRERLRAEVKKGVDDFENGDWHDADDMFDEIEAEIKEMIAKQEAGESNAAG